MFYEILTLMTVFCTSCSSQVIQFPKGDSCNVVNVNCAGDVGKWSAEHPRGPSAQGPQGKRGPVGPMEPQGPKGNIGETGQKGEAGESQSAEDVRREVLKMSGASSCEDLRKDGISEPGFHLLQDLRTLQPVYRYCQYQQGVATCHQLRARHSGVLYSGMYFFQPTVVLSYTAFCNFSQETATTEVWHEEMDEIEARKCEPNLCHSWTPRYRLNLDQIDSIMRNSRDCRQFLKLRCNGVLIFSGGVHSTWISRNGEQMNYWAGATSEREGYCACGETGTCVDNAYKCNCDNNNVEISTSDEGYLTDKTKLPVRGIKIGDNGDAGESAWYTLGKLECFN